MPPTLGRFQLHTPLGRGGSAVVWEARDTTTGAPTAVKVLRADAARDPRHGSLLRQEVRAMASLDHPHVVRIYDQGIVSPEAAGAGGDLVSGSPWLAMELTWGGTMSARAGRLEWSSARQVLAQLLDALGHAHARGVFHRDVKPGNVLFVDRRPVVKVADFGLRVALDDEVQVGTGGGTLAYMAPEQLDGTWRDHGPWTDLYGVACLAWKWAAGHTPFVGTRAEVWRGHLERAPPPLRPRHPVPDGLEDWLRWLLEKDPRDRPGFAADALRALHALGHAPDPAPAVAATPAAAPLRPDHTTESVTGAPGAGPAAAERPPDASLLRLRRVPLVARGAERASLADALHRVAREGAPHAVLLRGASGTGKSALARWIAERAHETGRADMLVAHHDLDGPDAGLRGMVHRHLRTRGLSGRELRRRLRDLLDDGEPSVDALASWLQPEVGGGPIVGLALVEALLWRFTRDRPLVLWLDDVQWGLGALGLAQRLLQIDADLPVLLVLTVRDDLLVDRAEEAARLDEIAAHPRTRPVAVPPLAPEDLRALVEQLVPHDAVTRDAVVDRAAGHPLFAVHLLEEALERPGAPLPSTVEALWQRRLEALLDGHPDWQEPLELAAALGQRVVGREWRAACSVRGLERPDALVEALLERRMATRTRTGSSTWAFVHGWLREAVLRRLPADRRASVHRACAEALVSLPGSEPERIGHHLVRAGAPEEALGPLLAGAERQLRLGGQREAARLIDAWRQATADAGLAPDDPRRADAFRTAWRLAMGARNLGRARTLVEGTLASARAHGWTVAEVHALGARSQMQGLAGGDGIDDARRAVDLAEALGDAPLAAGARLLLAKASARAGVGDPDTSLRAVAGTLESVGRHEGAADAWISLATSLFNRGRTVDALAAIAEAERVAERGGLGPHTRGVAHNLRGAAASAQGDPDQARAHYESAARLLGATAPHLADLASVNLALLEEQAGDLEAARERVSRVRGDAAAVQRGRLLVLLASAPDAADWELHLGALREFDRADPAGAAACERAGRRALRLGRRDRGAAALRLAAEQHRELGDIAEEQRLLDELDAL